MGDQDVRASDAEREHVADALRRAAGDGRLAPDELEERLTTAYGARTRGELSPLTADLPAPRGAPMAGGPPTAPPAAPSAWTAGLGERLGAWLVPNLICIGIWLASGADGYFWPVWVLLFTTVALVRSVVGGPHRRDRRRTLPPGPPGPPAPPPLARPGEDSQRRP